MMTAVLVVFVVWAMLTTAALVFLSIVTLKPDPASPDADALDPDEVEHPAAGERLAAEVARYLEELER